MMASTQTPGPKGGRAVLVSEPRRSQRTRFIKEPYDPHNNPIFKTAASVDTPQKKVIPKAGHAVFAMS